MHPISDSHSSNPGDKLQRAVVKQFVFRKLFGINVAGGTWEELHSQGRKKESHDTTKRSDETQSNIRRRSIGGGEATGGGFGRLASMVEEASDRHLDIIFNHLSAHSADLRSGDVDEWEDFSRITADVCHRIDDVRNHESLMTILKEFNFTMEAGWPKDVIDVDMLLQSFANVYLSEQSKQSHTSESHLKIKNIESLTFCPNVLFANFPHKFSFKPCSRSFESAVLLADISGFSKFAGEMCLRGAKGLDVLHKVTSDFLGHFVHTVYDYDGDGETIRRNESC